MRRGEEGRLRGPNSKGEGERERGWVRGICVRMRGGKRERGEGKTGLRG